MLRVVTNRGRGYTLLELLFVVGLLVMLIWLGSLQFHTAPSSARTQGLAERISEELRFARQKAISEGIPVALVFPTAGGTLSHSQGTYLLAGEEPRILRSIRFDGDYERTVAFVGSWGNAATTPPSPGANGEGFSVADWLPAGNSDHAFVFLPSGTVATDGIPLIDGSYRILISESIQYGGAPPTATPTGVFRPYTVTLAPVGTVTVEPGVAGGGVAEAASPPPFTPGGLPPSPAAAGGNAPEILGIQVQPSYSGADLPDGVTASVREGDVLTFIVRARDQDGGPLYCRWSGSGSFSSPGLGRMQWVAGPPGEWVSVWNWTPPAGDAVGTTYPLAATVTDPEGNSDLSTSAQSPVAGLISRESLVMDDPQGNLYVMNPDGSAVKRFPIPGPTDRPGDVHAGADLVVYNLSTSIYMMTLDGTRNQYVFEGFDATFSADGGMIFYTAFNYLIDPSRPGNELRWSSPDGSITGRIAGSDAGDPMLSPNNDLLLYVDRSNGRALTTVGFNRATCTVTGAPQVVDAGPTVHPAFSPDGTRIVYSKPAGGGGIWVSGLTGSGTRLTTGPDDHPAWSPSGDRIAFRRSGDLYVMNPDGSDLEQIPVTFDLDGNSMGLLRWSR